MDVVNEALKFASFITAPKPPRELDEMEAKVAAINGIDQELMNELREVFHNNLNILSFSSLPTF